MALQELPFFPDLPAFEYQITLDSAQYTLIFEYSDERESWYLSMEDAAGARLYTRQRLTPGADMSRTLVPNGPPGILSCVGADPYGRDELVIVYLPEADLSILSPARTDILVLIS